jgi:SnoaL-like domain
MVRAGSQSSRYGRTSSRPEIVQNVEMDHDPVTQILEDPRFRGAPVTWNVTPQGYAKIRHDWLTHVSAEEELFRPYSEDEFLVQTNKMLSVFIDDCVMELVWTGEQWRGKEEVRSFYRTLTTSFEEMEWTPQAVVIGPQGVLDVVTMTGTILSRFAGLTEVGQSVHLQWVIFFPWVPEAAAFQGETVYSIQPVSPPT